MDKLYELVKKIPKGRVITYNLLAKKLRLHPRQIARALNKNYNKNIPCHRIIMNSGIVGGYNRGIKKKISLLRKEGIKIKNNKIVNFKKVLYEF